MPANEDKDDDLYESVSRMADRLNLEGEERGQYIHEHMTRGGYRAVPNYVKEDDDGDSGSGRGSSFFGSGGRRRSSGGSGRGGGRSRQNRDDDDWYN